MVCNGFYGHNFGQPVCSTCHLFLFSNDVNLEDGEQEVYAEVNIYISIDLKGSIEFDCHYEKSKAVGMIRYHSCPKLL